MFTDDKYEWLERRLLPIGVDVVFWGMGCALLSYSFIAQLQVRDSRIWMAVAVVLAGAALVEIVTGFTPGKVLCGWAVRRPDGTRPPLWRLMLRGGTRLLPVAIFLSSLASSERLVRLVVMFAALTLFVSYVPACYIALVRRGLTAFDAMAGTRVVRTRGSVLTRRNILPERRHDG